MALITDVIDGLALCVLGDGSVAHLDRRGPRTWTLVHTAADGTTLAVLDQRRRMADLLPHPAERALLIATPSRGIERVEVGAGVLAIQPLAALPSALTLGAANDGTAIAATGGAGRSRYLLDPTTGALTSDGKAPAALRDLSAHPDDPGALLALAGSAARVRLYTLRPGAPPEPGPVLPRATRIAAVGAGEPGLLVGYDDGRTELTTATAGAAAVVLDAGAGPVWGLAVHGGVAHIGTGPEVRTVPLAAPPESPGVDLALDPTHYLGSWTRVRLTCHGGVDADQLTFLVDPPEGGLVSASRDASYDPASPDVLLALGGLVGDYKLVALDAATGDVLGATGFAVVDVHPGPDGPPVALIGPADGAAPDAAWGGGDPYVPQNTDVRPRRGDWRVAVVVVETADQPTLSAADATALETELRDEVFSGVNRGGVVESTRLYYREVSDNQLNLVEAGIVVPVRLPNNWDSYVTPGATGRTQGDGLSNFSVAAVAQLVAQNVARAARGQAPVLDLEAVDSLVLVLRSIPADPTTSYPGRHQWPYATRPGGYQQDFIVGYNYLPAPLGSIGIPRLRRLQALTMPTTWTTISSGRTIAETVGHELGHNFGLHDAYWKSTHEAQYQTRELGGWDLMGTENGAPQPSAVERMMLGWVPAAQVLTLSVGVAGYVDEEVTLHPASAGVPVPPRRRQAVELRIADGRNYYFEYRRDRAVALSDQTIPEDFVVVGTDYISGDTPPTQRRPLVLLRDDPDADGATFGLGDDYRESDTTDPSYPNDFAMTVLETAADFARVRLRYADAKPDPSILPWSQSSNWKSPDLRVENHRNRQNADPQLRDVPWEDHDNWIVAKVRNTGRDVARDVEVSFAVKDFTLGAGAEKPLGSVVIPLLNAGQEVEVTSPDVWKPPPLSSLQPWLTIRPHYCVLARITAQPDEITRDNNEAQSNHTRLISASASPSTRETGVVRVTNPHPVPARCRVVVQQSDPLSRTYLEHAWVLLEAGGERDVRFWTESMIGDTSLDTLTRERRSATWELPNSLRLTGVADTGEGCHGDTTGGAHVTVAAGRRTRFVDLEIGRGYARGRIEVEEDGSGVWGRVVISLRDDPRGDDVGVFTGEVRDGDFGVEFGDRERWPRIDEARVGQGEFAGGYSVAPCLSDWVEVR